MGKLHFFHLPLDLDSRAQLISHQKIFQNAGIFSLNLENKCILILNEKQSKHYKIFYRI